MAGTLYNDKLVGIAATTDATITTIITYTPPAESITAAMVYCTARRDTGGARHAWIYPFGIHQTGGGAAITGTGAAILDVGGAGLTITIDASAATARIRVTGIAAQNWDWSATLEVFTHDL